MEFICGLLIACTLKWCRFLREKWDMCLCIGWQELSAQGGVHAWVFGGEMKCDKCW